MQLFHEFAAETSQEIGFAVRILALVGGESDPLVARIAAIGGPVEVETELYAALSAIIDDPAGYGLLVMDCDAVGGVEAGQRAAQTLAAAGVHVPVILVSSVWERQLFPQGKHEATCLRAPLSTISLRVGFEHALRYRLAGRRI